MARRRRVDKHARFLRQNRHRYDELLASQGGVCAICKRPPPEDRKLDMDHSHREPMYLRGLLCRGCNMRLRKDMKSDWMRKAADYLDRGPA